MEKIVWDSEFYVMARHYLAETGTRVAGGTARHVIVWHRLKYGVGGAARHGHKAGDVGCEFEK